MTTAQQQTIDRLAARRTDPRVESDPDVDGTIEISYTDNINLYSHTTIIAGLDSDGILTIREEY